MVIRQGDVFWVDLGEPSGSEPGFRRPFAIIQNDAFNSSRIHTVLACALTSNLRLAGAPGNLRLNRGEANLPKPRVVNVSQVVTLDKGDLLEKIGQLSKERIQEMVQGLETVIRPIWA